MGRTLEEIRASRPKIDWEKVRATTEADIRRHMIEDGQDPDAPLSGFVTRLPGQRGPAKKPTKVSVTIRIDRQALDAFKAGGPGWQTRINDLIVREAVKARKRA